MNNQRKLILIAAAIGIISTFLPWISISAGAFTYSLSRSVNGFHSIGILYFIALTIASGISLMGNQREMLIKNMRFGVIGTGIVALLSIIIYYSGANDEAGSGFGFVNIHIKFGLILAVISTLAVITVCFLIKPAGENLDIDFGQLKNKVNSMQDTIVSAANTTFKKPNRMEELEKLITWKNEGKITLEEYENLKSKIV